MKAIKGLLIATSLILLFACIGTVSALESNEASASAVWASPTIHPNDKVPVVLTITSSSDEQLTVTKVGFHFDWMTSNEYFTNDLTATPVTIQPNSAHPFQSMVIQIPPYATPGSHKYYVALQGVQGSSATEFSWGSEDFNLEIVANANPTSSSSTTTPTSNAAGGDQGQNLLLYGAVIAVAVVVVLLVVLMLRRRRKPASQPTVEPAKSTETPSQSPSPGQDFSI